METQLHPQLREERGPIMSMGGIQATSWSQGGNSPIFCLREKADPQSHPQGRIRLWGEVRP